MLEQHDGTAEYDNDQFIKNFHSALIAKYGRNVSSVE